MQRERLPETLLGAERFRGKYPPGSRLQRSYRSSAPARVTVLPPITCRLVSNRKKPSIVNRQKISTAASTESYQCAAAECCGCWSQVSASHTLMSIKYEVVGRLRVGAARSGAPLSLQKGQCDALTPTPLANRGYPCQWLAPLRDHDPFLGQVFQERQALPAKFRDTEIPHI